MVVVCVPSVIVDDSPVEISGLGVVWVGNCVCGVIVVVLDWVAGLVLDAVVSTFNVVTIGIGGVIEEKVSSPSEFEVGLTVS